MKLVLGPVAGGEKTEGKKENVGRSLLGQCRRTGKVKKKDIKFRSIPHLSKNAKRERPV